MIKGKSTLLNIMGTLDKPTSGEAGNLDSGSTENIYTILRDINARFKTTFIIITHDRRIAEKTDRIIEIKDGRINMDINIKLILILIIRTIIVFVVIIG